MGPEFVLEPLYLLSALVGALSGARVCSTRVPLPTSSAYAAARLPVEMTAFVDVNVVPMDTARVLPHQTVLVKNGRIAALGPTSTVQVPRGALRIDGRGKYLMPGLGDMHVHGHISVTSRGDARVAPFLFTQLAGGVTSIRHVTYGGQSALTYRSWQPMIEKLSPYVYLAGWLPQFVKPGLPPDSVIAGYKAAGFDFLYLDNFSNSLGIANSDSLLAAAQRRGIPPAGHSHNESIDSVGAYGGSIEHMYSLLSYKFVDSVRQGLADHSTAQIRALAEAARRAGVWITPTLACHEYDVKRGPRVLELRRQLVKALYDAGAGLLSGAEGAYITNELAALVRAGLTPYQALVTSTRNVARYFSVLDSVGTVGMGKRADLVLLGGNPLADVEHTREPIGVMREGRWFDRAELDRRLLASPEVWVRLTFVTGLDTDPRVTAPLKKFEELSDSLATATPAAFQRVLQMQANELSVLRQELGAMRRENAQKYGWPEHARVTSLEMQKNFDPVIRAWIREQARRGHRVTVSGVTSP